MRTVLSALSVLLAVVLTAAAVPSLWIERNVVDEDGFVRLLAPLSRDADFQAALGKSLTATAVSASGVPAPLRPAATELAEKTLEGLTSDQAFPSAWESTLRESHRLNFSPATASTSAFTLELRPLANVVLDRLGAGLGVGFSDAPSITVPVGNAQQRSALTFAQDAAALALPLSAGAVLALLLGLLFARRRGTALAWAGGGLLVVAALLGAGTFLTASVAGSQGSQGSVAGVFAQRAGQLFADAFGPWILGVAAVGAVFLVVGLVLGARQRRLPAPQ
ncbi:hypothetical protein [Sinomonas sp. B1-1]|uniref:hypothetical protein n=1 Tax=Sinomonas sp. B1-1 TaxID=3141454 RepID=UPI003D29BCD0